MARFAGLEADQQVAGQSRRASDVSSATSLQHSKEDERELCTPESVRQLASDKRQQGAMEEVATSLQHPREEMEELPSTASGEWAVAPDTLPILPAWPWPGSSQGSSPFHTTYDTQGFRAPNTPWPSISTQFMNWVTPASLTADVGVWPYPSVLDTR